MSSLKSLAKTGFGLGLGIAVANIVFLIVGALFFIPGFMLFQRHKEETEWTVEKTSSFFLMGLGVLVMGGLGFGFFTEALQDSFSFRD